MAIMPIPEEYSMMYMVIATYVAPFSLIGFYGGVKWLMERVKISQGYMKCVFRTNNFRKVIKYMKPKDGIIQEKLNSGEVKTLECPTSAGYIFFEGKLGGTPVIEYNSERIPINFLPSLQDQKETQSLKDSLMLRIFNLGQKMGQLEIQKLQKLITIAAVISALCLIGIIILATGGISGGKIV